MQYYHKTNLFLISIMTVENEVLTFYGIIPCKIDIHGLLL